MARDVLMDPAYPNWVVLGHLGFPKINDFPHHRLNLCASRQPVSSMAKKVRLARLASLMFHFFSSASFFLSSKSILC
jgi:hypothetical protein